MKKKPLYKKKSRKKDANQIAEPIIEAPKTGGKYNTKKQTETQNQGLRLKPFYFIL